MQRSLAALLALAAGCGPTLRAADLEAEMRAVAREAPAPGAVLAAPIPLRRMVIRLDDGAPTSAPLPAEPAAGPRLVLREDAPRAAATAPRRLSVGPALPPIVVNERLAVVPLPTGAARGPAPPSPGALGGVPSTRAETTVPVASTGLLDSTAAGAYDDALSLVREDRCHDALVAFASFVARWPDHPHADNAMYWRGECLLRIGETRRGIEELRALLERFPDGNKAPDALLKLSLTWRRLGEMGRADDAAQRLLHDFPASDAARRMRAERQMQ